jgi:hypothetical protein
MGLGHEAVEEGRGRERVEDLPVAATAERAGETVQVPDGEGVFYLDVSFLEGVFYLWGRGRGRGKRQGVGGRRQARHHLLNRRSVPCVVKARAEENMLPPEREEELKVCRVD